ncbi:MAG: energy-coupling factor transporter transmembrane component T [Candidatus Caldarchaeum sp.]|nr:energy-coupling factor transporter transmembrane component T [Candidatus Caldarchaeum sp.]
MVAKRAFIFYLPESSPFLKANAISKMVYVIAVSVAALSVLDFYLNLAIMLFTIVVLFVAKVPLRNLKTWMYGFTFMLTFLTTIYTLVSKVPGENIYVTFPWGTYISENTLPRAFSVMFRIWSMIFAAMVFLSTTTDTDIITSLARFRIPYTFSFLISLSLRSVQIFADDWKTIIEAHWSKGVDLNKGSILQRLRNYVSLSIPLIIITLNRIRDIDFAAEARGFRLGIRERSYIDKFTWKIHDTAVVIMSVGLIFVVLNLAVF